MDFISIFKKGLFKDTAIYTATDAVGKAMSFLLLPFVSYYMTPDELGMATNFSVLTSIISLVAGLAIVNSLPYFFYEQTKDENRKLVSNIFLFCMATCLVLFLSILAGNSIIYNYIRIDAQFQLSAVLFVVMSILTNINMQLYRLEEKPKTFAIWQLAQIFLMTSFVIIFVIVLKLGGRGKILAELGTFVLLGIVHCYLLIKRGYLNFKYNNFFMRKVLKFGLPLMPHSLSFWFKSGADKVFITSFCGLHFNGIYSMAMSMGSVYNLISNAFFNAYTPYLQKKLAGINEQNQHAEKRKLVKISYLLMLAFLGVSLLSIFGAWVIIKFFVDSKYEEAFFLVPGIITAAYIYAIYSLTIQYIYKQKKTLVLGIITFSGSLIQMLFSYLFIQQFGVIGAVYSSILGTSIISVCIFYYSNKVYPLPWLYFLKKR